MKPSEELINYLEAQTKTEYGFPKLGDETAVVSIATLRHILNILKFQKKEPYRSTDGEDITSESALPTLHVK
jgi:hypothetical protein